MKNNKKFIYIVTAIFALLFAMLIGYLLYFTVSKRSELSVNPYNRRMDHIEQDVIRGDIYDANHILLATTKNGTRKYPEGSMYAHAVGYSQRGKIGVEALANTELLYPDYNFSSIIRNTFYGEKFHGRDVVLTLDHRYQQAIKETMQGYKGAVVVIESNTGKIKAMYSNPSFDPNNIIDNWGSLSTDNENTALLNRATNGLYPPGSIFKTITSIAYFQNSNLAQSHFEYECKGNIHVKDYSIQCYNQKAHGKLKIEEAFAKSCNTYFIALKDKINTNELKEVAEQLGFNKNLNFDLGGVQSKFQLTTTSPDFEKSLSYIGQGKTLVTPMHMAMLASCIANDGILMKPYIFDYSMTKSGKIKVKTLPDYEKPYFDETLSNKLKEMMIGVVNKGTATRLITDDLIVGGKTGTAENETDIAHSWFIGFAQDKDSRYSSIAFAIIVENGEKGAYAQTVARKIINTYKQVSYEDMN